MLSNSIKGGMVGFIVFNATFNNIQLYHGGQFYWWRKLEDQENNHRPVASH
jgi:hypothetical protein